MTAPPGTVDVRLPGDPARAGSLAASMQDRYLVLRRRGPYASRRGPGVRVCLRVCFATTAEHSA